MAINTNQRKANFYAGPSILPVPVLEELEATIADFRGAGMSIIETSHRSPMYDEIHEAAIGLIRELLGLPDDYHVLFLGGGATLQFSMVPMNLMAKGGKADYVLSGAWAEKAIEDAKKVGTVSIIWDGSNDRFTSLPDSLSPDSDASYVHITTNETINGVQWMSLPDTGGVPLVADMSSDIMSRPLEVSRLGMLYAGAQKNLGPAGVTLVVMRDDLVQGSSDDLTAYLSYKIHAAKNSLYNTPPVFSIYAVKLVLEWIKSNGGLEMMRKNAETRSNIIYDAIDKSGGFYVNPVTREYRSTMNVVFTLADEGLQDAFLKKASNLGMVGLKGHRSVGGCRVSLYNAMPMETVQSLGDFMNEFARSNG